MYVRLLIYQWNNGCVPSDTKRLARIAGCSQDEFTACWEEDIEPCFEKAPDGRGGWALRNKRLEIERKKVVNTAEQRRKAGIKSGQARRKKSDNQKPGTNVQHPFELTSNEGPTIQSHNHIHNQEKGRLSTSSSSAKLKTPDCPHQKIVDLYHEVLPELPRVKVFNANRQKMLRARWREDSKRQNIEWWRKYFTHIRTVPFLMEGKGSWKGADFDFVISPSKIVKIIEGSYE